MPRRRRDVQDTAPPSSRRPTVGFRFATIASLVRHQRYPIRDAERLVDDWRRYVRYAMLSGKSPTSTAEHLVRFEHILASTPQPKRDPQRRGAVTIGRRRHVPREYVDQAIAEDLRKRAWELVDDDPEHARELFRMSEEIGADTRDPQRRLGPLPVGTPSETSRRRTCGRGVEPVTLIFPAGSTAAEVRAWTKRNGFSSTQLEFPGTGTIRATQRPSSDFVKGTFGTKILSPKDNILAVFACPKPGRESDKTRRRRPRRRSSPRTSSRKAA